MIEFKDFKSEEINDSSLCRIYQSMLEHFYENRIKQEIIFNKYSIELDYDKGVVTIYDDIYIEDEPLTLELRTFFKIIKEQ